MDHLSRTCGLTSRLTRPHEETPIPSCAGSPSTFSELINRCSSSNGRNLISWLRVDELPQHACVRFLVFSMRILIIASMGLLMYYFASEDFLFLD